MTFISMAPAQRAQRLLLQTLMKKHGFSPYPQEWWHFALKNEPYPIPILIFLSGEEVTARSMGLWCSKMEESIDNYFL